MKKTISILVAGLLLAVVSGCRTTGPVALLSSREELAVTLQVETEPADARVISTETGLPIETNTWEIEKLTWSDGSVNFRISPNGIPIALGENLSVRVVGEAKGFQRKKVSLSVPFNGKQETVTRKVTLEK